jgi:hypothetical protein
MAYYITKLVPVSFAATLRDSFAAQFSPANFAATFEPGARVIAMSGTRWADLTGNTWASYSGQRFSEL